MKIKTILSPVFSLYIAEVSAAVPVNPASSVLQMIFALGLIIGMIFALVWAMKKMGYKGYSQSKLINVKSCLPLSSKEKLLLVNVGDEQILIGVAPGFIGHIKTIENPIADKVGEGESAATLFSEKLKAMMNKNKSDVIE